MKIVTLLSIGLGGFIGAILRAYVVGLVNNSINRHIPPFGTLTVNILGSLILGSLLAFFTYSEIFSPHVKSFLSTGLMGAFTTYSTFAIETVMLINGGMLLAALGNMALNLFGSVIFAGIGYKSFEYLLK